MQDQPEVLTDLIAEADAFDTMLDGLDESRWRLGTPAPGWTIAHQVAHLAATFRLAALAAADPPGFQALLARLGDDFDANVAAALAPYLAHPPEVLRARWRAERDGAVRALGALAPGAVVAWLVRPLPAAVLAAAGIMELFAHGQDVADTLGIEPERTDRIRHLVAFAVRTWDFGYLARRLTPPQVQFRFELVAPSGARWEHGPAGAAQRITGPAVDFCLLVTRRRHRGDLALRATGPDADRWLDIAQAYRGSPGPGRAPGQFARAPR